MDTIIIIALHTDWPITSISVNYSPHLSKFISALFNPPLNLHLALSKAKSFEFLLFVFGRWRINLLSARSASAKLTIFIVRVGSSLFARRQAIPEMQIFRCESRDNKLAGPAAASCGPTTSTTTAAATAPGAGLHLVQGRPS